MTTVSINICDGVYEKDAEQLMAFVETVSEGEGLIIPLVGKIETSLYNSKASLYIYRSDLLTLEGNLDLDVDDKGLPWMGEIQVWDKAFMLLQHNELFLALLERVGITKGESSMRLLI